MAHSITAKALIGAMILTMMATSVASRPPGHMVDIGGRSLHVVQTDGEGPVIVLEAGGGGFSSFWLKVQPRIRDELGLPTMSYDRAGLGWSDPSAQPYRIADKADDLDALLTTLEVDQPVILVAHSYGGWVAQAFASRYPERIAGIVLVDPNSSHFFSHFSQAVEKIEADGRKRPVRGLKRIGLRLMRNWLAKNIGSLKYYFDPILTDRHQAALGEALASFGKTAEALDDIRLPDRPTIMISRGLPQKGFPWGNALAETRWREGHQQLIEHLSEQDHWIADQSAHAVVVEQPDIIVDAIEAIVEQLE